jgi:hypothetical protein
VITGFQVPAQDYLAVEMDSKAWGVVNWLSREYCLWGVIVWLCMNGGSDSRGSAAWIRLRAFVDMWGAILNVSGPCRISIVNNVSESVTVSLYQEGFSWGLHIVE